MSLENPTIVQATSNTVTVVVNPSLNQIAVVEPQRGATVVRDSVIRGPEGPSGPSGPGAEAAYAQANAAYSKANAAYNEANLKLNIAGGTLTGTLNAQNILPSVDATYNLGSPTKRFKDLYLTSSTIYIGNTALNENASALTVSDNVGNTIVINASSQLLTIGSTNIYSNSVNTITLNVQSDAVVGGNLKVNGDISVDGNLIIGNVNTDTVTIIADFTSNLVPDSNNSFNLGAPGKEWKNLYLGSANLSGSLNVAGDISLNGNLIIGNVNTDTISVVADFTSNLIPDSNNSYSLGTPAQEWKNLYANTANLSAALNVSGVVLGKGNTISIGHEISDLSGSQSVNTTYVAANVVISGPTQTTYNVFTTNSDVPHAIDSFPSSQFTTVKYIIQAKSVDGYHSTELFTMQDGISAYLTEYATLINNYTLGSYSLTVSGGVCNLIFHPNNPMNNIITVKLVRTALTA